MSDISEKLASEFVLRIDEDLLWWNVSARRRDSPCDIRRSIKNFCSARATRRDDREPAATSDNDLAPCLVNFVPSHRSLLSIEIVFDGLSPV